MTLVQASLWIIICTLLLVACVKSSCSAARMLKKNGTAADALIFLFNMFAVMVCVFGIYLAVERIAKYQEAPRVYTSTPPQVDTLTSSTGMPTYVYKFQDNTWPNLR